MSGNRNAWRHSSVRTVPLILKSLHVKKKIHILAFQIYFLELPRKWLLTQNIFFFLFPLRFSTVPRGIIYSFFKMCVDGHTCISNCLWVASWKACVLKGDTVIWWIPLSKTWNAIFPTMTTHFQRGQKLEKDLQSVHLWWKGNFELKATEQRTTAKLPELLLFA